MSGTRDEFSLKTRELLATRVGLKCSRCQKLTKGPHSNQSKTLNLGVAAHITAASAGGPRYDSSLTSEERKSDQNGIWLCYECSVLIDQDPDVYPTEKLKEYKQKAEQATRDELSRKPKSSATNSDSGSLEGDSGPVLFALFAVVVLVFGLVAFCGGVLAGQLILLAFAVAFALGMLFAWYFDEAMYGDSIGSVWPMLLVASMPMAILFVVVEFNVANPDPFVLIALAITWGVGALFMFLRNRY